MWKIIVRYNPHSEINFVLFEEILKKARFDVHMCSEALMLKDLQMGDLFVFLLDEKFNPQEEISDVEERARLLLRFSLSKDSYVQEGRCYSPHIHLVTSITESIIEYRRAQKYINRLSIF